MASESQQSDLRLPFLKWTGGKRWLAREVESLLPATYGRYFEPFVGGGAVFFHLRPYPATLSDINSELVNVYRQIRDNVEKVLYRLSRLRISAKAYLRQRANVPELAIDQAVRLLYLNRTAFNGIYRVNRQGQFNVPFGCKAGTVLCDRKLLRSASDALQNRRLVACDFEQTIDQAQRNDVVYVDPPYTVKHDNNGFRRYNEVIFSWEDQERLAKCCLKAVKRGATVIVSNANHEPLIQLYKGFSIKLVSRPSLISGTLQGRGTITECLLYSSLQKQRVRSLAGH